jgi:hypothetical protein
MASSPQITKRPNQILFVLDLRNDWGLYMHNLFKLVKETDSNIHLLEIEAPLGTGSFTSNNVSDSQPPAPVSSKPNAEIPIQPAISANATLAAPDTRDVTVKTSAFIDELLEYFKSAGVYATGDWKPEFDTNQLGEYAERIGAKIIALPRQTMLEGIFQHVPVHKLEERGLKIELLDAITDTELETLKNQNAHSGDITMNSQQNPDHSFSQELNQEAQKLASTDPQNVPPVARIPDDQNSQTTTEPSAVHDSDLASKPAKEREQLLDQERREEMNEHDDARVDGKHYHNPDQATAVKEADADEHASEHLGARDEEMDRTQGPPAMGSDPAPGKGQRPVPK